MALFKASTLLSVYLPEAASALAVSMAAWQRGLLHVGGERNECLLAVLELGHLLGDLFFGGVGIVVHSLGSVNDLLELSP